MEEVADDAVPVCLVDHFLIEIGGEKLDFGTLVMNGTVNDLPGIGESSGAPGNVWGVLEGTYHNGNIPHEVDVLFLTETVDL